MRLPPHSLGPRSFHVRVYVALRIVYFYTFFLFHFIIYEYYDYTFWQQFLASYIDVMPSATLNHRPSELFSSHFICSLLSIIACSVVGGWLLGRVQKLIAFTVLMVIMITYEYSDMVPAQSCHAHPYKQMNM